MEEKEKKTGTLYIVSTPIGNDEDITQRALRTLKSCDIVVCEEAKIGARTLHRYNISKKLETLNEQNEYEKTGEIIKMLLDGTTVALISDDGTPVFADPGLELVRSAIAKNIKIIVIPGVSSLMTAIVRSGFPIDRFVYGGFLSRDKEVRFAELRRLREESRTVVILDTPYRMLPLLDAAAKLMPERQAYMGCNLTMPFETHHYGTFSELYEKFKDLGFKGEFIIVFAGSPHLPQRFDERKPARKEYRRAPEKKYQTKSSDRKQFSHRTSNK